jgi:methylated-DNA-[protein]-cysteine S-methyltransferase
MIVDTPFGPIGVEFRGGRLLRIELHPAKKVARKAERSGEASRLCSDLSRYFAGKKVSFSGYRVDLSRLPGFTRQVLLATRRIPYGECRSYGELAGLIGHPKAARAVGGALGRNPIPIVIPCHRVIRTNGSVGGFGAGIELKRRLLALEGIEVSEE